MPPHVRDNQTSTYKKVVIRKLDRSVVKGYVESATYLRLSRIELIDCEGRAVVVPLPEIKAVFFVRDFDGNPQRSERKLFQSRPRLAGLWVQMTFKDNEILEGLLPNNLVEISPEGFLLTPADLYSNNLRIFVPRSALSKISVLGVIPDGRPRRLPQKGRGLPSDIVPSEGQIGLFSDSEEQEKKL